MKASLSFIKLKMPNSWWSWKDGHHGFVAFDLRTARHIDASIPHSLSFSLSLLLSHFICLAAHYRICLFSALLSYLRRYFIIFLPHPPTILGVQCLIVALTATTTTRVSVCAVHPPVEAAGAMYDALKYSAECALLEKTPTIKCRLINVEQAISNRHPVSCYLGKCRHTTDMCPPLHNPDDFFLHPCRTLTRRRWACTSGVYIYILFPSETTLSLAPFGPLSIPLSFYSFRQC